VLCSVHEYHHPEFPLSTCAYPLNLGSEDSLLNGEHLMARDLTLIPSSEGRNNSLITPWQSTVGMEGEKCVAGVAKD